MAKNLFAVGNWKMYKTAREATDFIEELTALVEGVEVNIYLAVPYTSIAPATQFSKETAVVIGAQNMNDSRDGAFTGEIAGLMLKEAGASFALIGHSERRTLFGETDEMIHRKIIRALQDDIQPILCVGELREDYDEGRTHQVLENQILTAFKNIPEKEAQSLILAYEPVWAIGTGRVPSPEEIQKTHAFCREMLIGLFGKKIGSKIPILYGGSVKPENVFQIVSEKDVDGVLVGGASLDPVKFSEIIRQIEKTLKSNSRKKEKTE